MLKIFRIIPFLLFITIATIHWFWMSKHAINIPYGDEWDFLGPRGFPSFFNLGWLFENYNEHKIFATKVITWVFYQLTSWNLISYQIVNYGLYLSFIIFVLHTFRSTFFEVPRYILWGFFLFLLTQLNYEVHNWPVLNQIHFCFFFFLAGIMKIYKNGESTELKDQFQGWLLIAFSSFNFSSGIALVLGTLIVYLLQSYFWHRSMKELLLAFFFGGMTFFYHGLTFEKPAHHPMMLSPFEPMYWNFILNMFSFGFGYTKMSLLPGFFLLLLFTLPWVFHAKKKNVLEWKKQEWFLLNYILSFILVYLMIGVGRGNFGVDTAKTSRYAEIGMLLVPALLCSYSLVIHDYLKSKRELTYFGLWGVLFFGYWNHYGPAIYRTASSFKRSGYECVQNYYRKKGTDYCPQIYPKPLKEHLNRAKELNISFYQESIAEPPK